MNITHALIEKPLAERIAALSNEEKKLLARRATVSTRTLSNIQKGLFKQHASTLGRIERAMVRIEAAKQIRAE